jgi:hypothetical protein
VKFDRSAAAVIAHDDEVDSILRHFVDTVQWTESPTA